MPLAGGIWRERARVLLWHAARVGAAGAGASVVAAATGVALAALLVVSAQWLTSRPPPPARKTDRAEVAATPKAVPKDSYEKGTPIIPIPVTTERVPGATGGATVPWMAPPVAEAPAVSVSGNSSRSAAAPAASKSDTPPRARRSRYGGDICARHGLRKVTTRGGKSWRCQR